MKARTWMVLAAGALPTTQLAGQSLSERLAEHPEGAVWFTFEAKDGVHSCGGEGLDWARDGQWSRGDCREGPIEVRLELEGGIVRRLRASVAWNRPPSGAGLGDIPPQEAADWLLALVDRAGGTVGERALGAAALAQGVVLWPRLLQIARDQTHAGKVRKAAVFWLGQEASEQALEGLSRIAREDPELEVRKAAVFSLSRRDAEESIPLLSEIALSDADPELRSTAFFWLGQMDDPRVLALFARVLGG